RRHGKRKDVLESVTSFIGGGGPRVWWSVVAARQQKKKAPGGVNGKEKDDTNKQGAPPPGAPPRGNVGGTGGGGLLAGRGAVCGSRSGSPARTSPPSGGWPSRCARRSARPRGRRGSGTTGARTPSRWR